jgi:hypothetical protein
VHKGPQPRDGFAENEVLHLSRTFVADKCFGVGEESSNVVIDRPLPPNISRPHATVSRHLVLRLLFHTSLTTIGDRLL